MTKKIDWEAEMKVKEKLLFGNDTLWKKIMWINKTYIPLWKFKSLDSAVNCLVSELGEVASMVKVYYGRGTNSKNKKVPQALDFAIELFDLYVYIILTLETLDIDENLFNEIGNQKLIKILNRVGALK